MTDCKNAESIPGANFESILGSDESVMNNTKKNVENFTQLKCTCPSVSNLIEKCLKILHYPGAIERE